MTLTSPRIAQALGPNSTLLLEQSDANSIVAVTLGWTSSADGIQPSEAGLPGFMHRLLKRGTRKRNEEQVAEALDSLGITIQSSSDENYTRASLIATHDTWREGLDLLTELVQQPAFEPEELEKERNQTHAALRRADDDLMGCAERAWHAAAFPGHAYGLPSLGTPQTVSEYTQNMVAAMHEVLLRQPIHMATIVGNVTETEARESLAPFLSTPGSSIESGDGNSQPEEQRDSAMAPLPPEQDAEVEQTRKSNQSFLFLGVRACPYGSEDWVALRVMNTILGEGMSSRLFVKLRDEQGLAYATGSSLSGMRHASTLTGYIGTKPESLQQALNGMCTEFERMMQESVPEEELDRARKSLMGRYLIDQQTNARRGFYPLHFAMMNLGPDYGDTYPDLIQQINADEVQRVAQKYLSRPRVKSTLSPA